MNRDACEKAAAIFRALGDTARLQMLAMLSQGDMCVTEIAERLGDSLSAVSQRLKLLRSAAHRPAAARWQTHFLFPCRSSCRGNDLQRAGACRGIAHEITAV